MKNILGFIGFVILVSGLFKHNFGFVERTSYENIGYNVGSLLVYILAGWLVYRAIKK